MGQPSPIIFLSHDSRDTEIAAEFSSLLKRSSIGLLSCFFSSDNKGTSGIEFGQEWFTKIKDQIKQSVHLVCLLTNKSVGRPWILFEAGIAKGLESTPVTALLLGNISANVGPLGHLQNCHDDDDSITKLIQQLIRQSYPESQPDINKDAIKREVKKFKRSVNKILRSQAADMNSRNPDSKQPEAIVEFLEKIKKNTAEAMGFGDNMNTDLFFSSFFMQPRAYLKVFFDDLDKQFMSRISKNGTMRRLDQTVEFSSEIMLGSLLELGLPLSLSLRVPSIVIDILESLLKDPASQDEVSSNHIRMAVIRSFDYLEVSSDFSPEKINIFRSSYIRRYGNPDKQYLKVIDFGSAPSSGVTQEVL
jgi:hypothetical protein